jgi:glycosyltransferase involved in cell wall biosynthesis
VNQSLTVLIPYYKRRYLEAALESLAVQTNQNFDVFIGDDNSPEDPSDIIEKFRGRLKINYRRFSENFGRTSLTGQWNRCVRETSSEWVWLFSDDDLATADCVADFYDTLVQTANRFDLYRFNTKVIDGDNKVLYDSPAHPPVETEAEFVFGKLSQGRMSFAVEYIFRRSAFEAAGGFIHFPLAWCSDDASWLAFSRRTGTCTMPKAKVLWRLSASNLSAPDPKLVGAKLGAFRKYLLWLRREFQDSAIHQRIRDEAGKWFPHQIKHWGGKPGWLAGVRFWLFFSWFTHKWDYALFRQLVQVPPIRASLKKMFR